MSHKKNISPGDKFGQLTVLKEEKPIFNKSGRKIYRYLCKCDCGKEKIISHRSLLGGTTTCGCASIQNIVKLNTKHGLRGDRLYEIYRHMIYRCYYPNSPDYKHYGGRNIHISNLWLGTNGFENFKNWSLENGYQPDLTIDRINVHGDYEPTNCRWTTNIVQQRNKTNNFYISYKGETKTCAEWAEIYNINMHSLYYRIKTAHWDVKKALETPINKRKTKSE